MMDVRGFWRIVDACRRAEHPHVALHDKLARLDPSAIAAFDGHFCDRVDDAFTWDLWGAAYMIEGASTEDEFLAFRYGLIALGRSAFEQAVQNPDTLARVDVEPSEEYGAVALEVYRDATGQKLARSSARSDPHGRRWDFDDVAERRQRLPKLQRKLAIEAFNELHLEAWEKTEQDDREGADELYARALTLLAPDDRHDGIALVHGNMMSNAEALGRMDDARSHFATARRMRDRVLDTEQRALLDNQLAWFAYEHGTKEECEEAVAWAHEAAARSSEPLPVMDTEARLLIRLGREGAARAVVKRALAIDPHFEALQDLKARWKLG